MSLIDPLTIVYSNARAQNSFSGTQNLAINGIRNLLVGVGWSDNGDIKATGAVRYPLGAPISFGVEGFPKITVGCPATPFLVVGAVNFAIYDPYTETPGVGSCVMVPVGLTSITTLSNLASAVTAHSLFDASVVALGPSSFIINFTAKSGGPDFSFLTITGDGRWGQIGDNAGLSVGGGYRLISKFDPEITQYQLILTGVRSIFGNILFEFSVNGGSAFYNLRDDGTYTLVANGYGFFLRNSAGDGSYPFASYSIFAMAPKMPAAERFKADTQTVFILGPRTFKNFTYYYGSGGPISTALDTAFATFGNTGGWPRLLGYRNPGRSLTGTNGKPFTFAAYITYGPSSTSSANVIGKLPDCAMITTALTPYGQTEIEGQIYTVVSSQTGDSGNSASSLLFLSPLPVAPPVSPDPSPVYPNTQPSTRTGTCNIFGSGVTALTGNFTGLAAQSPITINGIPYLISSVDPDGIHLTLTTATAISENVVWTVP